MFELKMQFETLAEFQQVLLLLGGQGAVQVAGKTDTAVRVPDTVATSKASTPDIDPDEQEDTDEDPDYRELGASSEGRSRRVKSELAEDKVLEDLAEELNVPKANLEKSIKKNGRAETLAALQKQKDEGDGEVEDDEKPEISKNPENRKSKDDDGDEDETYTKADVRGYMSKLMEKIGQDKAREFMVTETGAGKLGEIEESDYADFVKAIKGELGE